MPAPADLIDVRTVPPPQRPPPMFRTFDALARDDAFEVVHDHGPVPRRARFARSRPGPSGRRCRGSGSRRWHLGITHITRVGPQPSGAVAVDCGGSGRHDA